jgi:hypothetical protein
LISLESSGSSFFAVLISDLCRVSRLDLGL